VGDPHRQFPAIHVAGTNGKGSVCTLAYEALRAAGRRTALYTSPHLVDVRERMVVDGQPISAAAFAAWTEQLRPAIERSDASFFEATTAIAFADFAARGADVAVVEVGLGGRLDSTNVLQPLVSAVTHIALEHTAYLGPTLAGIAREKAGVAKRGVPFVVGEPDDGLAAVLADVAQHAGAPVIRVPPAARYHGALGLAGPHQRRNAAVTAAVLEVLPPWLRPPDDAIARGFARARLPGRYDRRGRWLFDVAHNPDGVRTLLATLAAAPPPAPVRGLVAILDDKDWRTMLGLLLEQVSELWITNAPSAPAARRWRLDVVAAAFRGRVRVEPDLDAAIARLSDADGTVLVCGSFHTVGDVMARLPGFLPFG
jgi:dihydrofolate synthase/folylpolyglutamate synthase